MFVIAFECSPVGVPLGGVDKGLSPVIVRLASLQYSIVKELGTTVERFSVSVLLHAVIERFEFEKMPSSLLEFSPFAMLKELFSVCTLVYTMVELFFVDESLDVVAVFSTARVVEDSV